VAGRGACAGDAAESERAGHWQVGPGECGVRGRSAGVGWTHARGVRRWAAARGEGRSLGRAGGARWVVGPSVRRGEVGLGSRGCGLKQAKEEMGLARGEGESGLGYSRAGPGRGKWAAGLVLVGFFLFSISIYSLFSILNQTKFEFKYKFEFKPHSNN